MKVSKFLVLSIGLAFGNVNGMWRAGTRGMAGVIAAKALHHATAGQRSFAAPKEFKFEPIIGRNEGHGVPRNPEGGESRQPEYLEKECTYQGSVLDACKLIAEACNAQEATGEALEMLRCAVASKKDVNEKDEKGHVGLYYLGQKTSLWRWREKGCDAYEKAVLLLIDKGADVKEVRFDDQQTLLHVAARENQIALVEPLIQAGLDVHGVCRGSTPLHMAVEWNHLGMTEELLRLGASIHFQNSTACQAPLHLVRSPEMVGLLLRNKANKEACNCYGNTPLIMAVIRGKPEVVEKFIDEGVSLDALGGEGRSALELAQYYRRAFGWTEDREKVTTLLEQAAARQAESKSRAE